MNFRHVELPIADNRAHRRGQAAPKPATTSERDFPQTAQRKKVRPVHVGEAAVRPGVHRIEELRRLHVSRAGVGCPHRESVREPFFEADLQGVIPAEAKRLAHLNGAELGIGLEQRGAGDLRTIDRVDPREGVRKVRGQIVDGGSVRTGSVLRYCAGVSLMLLTTAMCVTRFPTYATCTAILPGRKRCTLTVQR